MIWVAATEAAGPPAVSPPTVCTLIIPVAAALGDADGLRLGLADGLRLGLADGLLLGLADGLADGLLLGLADGLADGLALGLSLVAQEMYTKPLAPGPPA